LSEPINEKTDISQNNNGKAQAKKGQDPEMIRRNIFRCYSANQAYDKDIVDP
jgi:hypothetical protein